ncbi:MAG: hypothetical protein KKA64_04505 [Nanoarchaeota archaeon]|nr:hypothetical protein [Nanoarchaeota archaeon]
MAVKKYCVSPEEKAYKLGDALNETGGIIGSYIKKDELLQREGGIYDLGGAVVIAEGYFKNYTACSIIGTEREIKSAKSKLEKLCGIKLKAVKNDKETFSGGF